MPDSVPGQGWSRPLQTISATAPGKALVCGEYAVLHGAPAVVMALNRRARVTVDAAPGDSHEVVAPGYSDVTGRFRLEPDGIRWLEQELDAYALFASVVSGSGAGYDAPRRFSLDTRAFTATGGQKLGLGSSAALAAALATALSATSREEVLPLLAAASGHQAFQQGRGSGADVASALAGGLIEYRMGETGWAVLDWPTGLRYRYFFSGVSADTRERIDRASIVDAKPDRLCELATLVAECFRAGNPREIMIGLRHYVDELRSFSHERDLDIFAAGHDVLTDAAADLGMVYKPCGAGGGDIGIAIAHEDTAIGIFSQLAAANDFQPLDIELDPLGARVSE